MGTFGRWLRVITGGLRAGVVAPGTAVTLPVIFAMFRSAFRLSGYVLLTWSQLGEGMVESDAVVTKAVPSCPWWWWDKALAVGPGRTPVVSRCTGYLDVLLPYGVTGSPLSGMMGWVVASEPVGSRLWSVIPGTGGLGYYTGGVRDGLPVGRIAYGGHHGAYVAGLGHS